MIGRGFLPARRRVPPHRECKCEFKGDWEANRRSQRKRDFLAIDKTCQLANLTTLRETERIMPNTKSAERRMRNSARKQQHNRSIVSKLRKVERDFRATVAAGKKNEALKLLPSLHSAFDKAVKFGVVKRPTANRKKSRLSLSLAKAPVAAK